MYHLYTFCNFQKRLKCCVISRPVQSQGLIYKPRCHSFINSLILFLTSLYIAVTSKCDYVSLVFDFLNFKVNQNWIIGSKVEVIFPKVLFFASWLSCIDKGLRAACNEVLFLQLFNKFFTGSL